MNISRRRFLRDTTASLATVLASRDALSQPGPKPLNIVYVFSDEHRYHSMSFTRQPELHTPAMERMREEGVNVSHCISNYPVCSPYRAILMTSRWPFQTGVIDNGLPLPTDVATLGSTFRSAGYQTGYVGKWHLGGKNAQPYGFDYSRLWTGTNNHRRSTWHEPGGGETVAEGYNATLMTDQALEFIRANVDEPFFLALSLNPPHANFLDAPTSMRDMYPPGSLERPKNYRAPDLEQEANHRIWNQNNEQFYRGYHAHVSAVDRELERILDTVSEAGIRERTLVIYTSDHGSMLGSHGVGSKRQPYEESIRVPFLMWGGPTPAGRTCETSLGTIDIFPTLCGLVGLEPPNTVMGEDISSEILGHSNDRERTQLIMHISKSNASAGESHPGPIFRGLRTRRWTYAVLEDGIEWLFDNRSDPYQLNNIAELAEHDELVRRLRKDLRVRLLEAEDSFLQNVKLD